MSSAFGSLGALAAIAVASTAVTKNVSVGVPLLSVGLLVVTKSLTRVPSLPLLLLVAVAAVFSGTQGGLAQPESIVVSALLAVAAVEL